MPIYGVATKRLNEQVKWNARRFPDDFVFRLTDVEKAGVVAKCDHLSSYWFEADSTRDRSGTLRNTAAVFVRLCAGRQKGPTRKLYKESYNKIFANKKRRLRLPKRLPVPAPQPNPVSVRRALQLRRLRLSVFQSAFAPSLLDRLRWEWQVIPAPQSLEDNLVARACAYT